MSKGSLTITVFFLFVFALISADCAQSTHGPSGRAAIAVRDAPDSQDRQPGLSDPSEDSKTCPQERYINCMPIVPEEKRFQCSPEYLEWIKANCPGVEVVY